MLETVNRAIIIRSKKHPGSFFPTSWMKNLRAEIPAKMTRRRDIRKKEKKKKKQKRVGERQA